MIALEVTINGKFMTRAGREDLSVLNTMINAVGVLGNESKGATRDIQGTKFFLQVGGMTSKKNGERDVHLRWLQEHLKIGDEITVKLIECAQADPSVREEPVDETSRQESERKNFESAKQYYLENKHKYE